MNRLFICVVLGALAVGCKKDSKDAAGGAGAQGSGSQAGQAGKGGEGTKVAAASAEKNPEGCNSDLAQKIVADYTFTEKCSPYTVSNELYVDGYNLTIEPGVEVRFKEGGALYVAYHGGAKLLVKGTPEKPVRFTAATRKEEGAWRNLTLYERAAGSTIENAIIEFAGVNDTAALELQAADVTVKGVKIVKTRKKALIVAINNGIAKELSGLDLSEAGGDPDELVNIGVNSLGVLGQGNKFADKVVIGTTGNVNREVKISAQPAPYRFVGDFYVEAPEGKTGSLWFEAGATVQVSEGAAIYVGYAGAGALKIAGTAEKPVTFTRYGDDPKASPWKGFTFYSKSRAPDIDWAVLEYAGLKAGAAMKYEGPRGLGKLTNTVFRHVAGDAVDVDDAQERFTAFDANTFEDVGGAPVSLPFRFAHNLGVGNKLGATGFVKITGNATEDVLLKALAAPYRLEGELYIESTDGAKTATVTVEPGTSVTFSENSHLYLGYHNPGRLIAKGAGDKPITFGAAAEGQRWKGIVAYDRGTIEGEHLTLSAIADESWPIEAQGAEAKGTLKNVTLKDTKKGIRTCGKLTAADVKADKGVKVEEKCQ